MRLGTVLRAAWEWVPLPLIAVLVVIQTDGFTRGLPFETWLFYALVLVGNVTWIIVMGGVGELARFHERYPGFRMKK